jgi:hypothetical protein
MPELVRKATFRRSVSARVSGNLVHQQRRDLAGGRPERRWAVFWDRFVVAEELAAGTLVPLMPAFGGVNFAVDAFYPHRQGTSLSRYANTSPNTKSGSIRLGEFLGESALVV